MRFEGTHTSRDVCKPEITIVCVWEIFTLAATQSRLLAFEIRKSSVRQFIQWINDRKQYTLGKLAYVPTSGSGDARNLI